MHRDFPQRRQDLTRQPWYLDGLDATERAYMVRDTRPCI